MNFFSKRSSTWWFQGSFPPRRSSTVALYLGVTLVASVAASSSSSSNQRHGRVGRGGAWGHGWWNHIIHRAPTCQLQPPQAAAPIVEENAKQNQSSSLYPDVRPPARPWASWSSLFRPKDWKPEYQRYQEALLRHDEYRAMPDPATVMIDSHAIAGALLKEHHIEAYRVFAKTATIVAPKEHADQEVLEKRNAATLEHSATPQVVALVRVGTKVDGHYGIVHGGIAAMLVDDVLGYGFYSLGWPAAFTANLSVNYRQPIPAQTILRIECYFERQERRKLYWTVRVVDARRPSTLYVDATSLFVIPKQVYEKHGVVTEK